jgi:hypothetical protein
VAAKFAKQRGRLGARSDPGPAASRKMDSAPSGPTMPAMESKKRSTAVVTEGGAQAALRRGPARELAPEEERVIRMRLGAAVPRTAPLERAAEPRTDLEIELLSHEIEAYLKWKARTTEATPAPRTRGVAAPQPSRTKEKIVRALRKKS